MVTVIATDSFGASASIEVTITVTDENEGPAITGRPRRSIDYDENGTGPVAALHSGGPGGQRALLPWSLKDDDED